MSERRMFSKRIVNSARFLKMPAAAQMLYFHLGMNADDDGIVEGFNVVRVTGCTEEDLRLLEDRGFVQILNEDLVTHLTDWEVNNKIRADRRTESIYKDLLTEDGPLSDTCQTNDGQVTDICQASDGQMTGTCSTNDRIGKDSIGKDSIGQDNKREREPQKRFRPPSADEVRAYIAEKGYTHVDADRFVAFYASKDWMIGKNKMKDWKASVAGWEARDKQSGKKAERPPNRFAVKDQANTYDFDDLERKARERQRV